MLLERELAMQKQLLLNGFALSILLYNGVQKAVMAAEPNQRLLARDELQRLLTGNTLKGYNRNGTWLASLAMCMRRELISISTARRRHHHARGQGPLPNDGRLCRVRAGDDPRARHSRPLQSASQWENAWAAAGQCVSLRGGVSSPPPASSGSVSAPCAEWRQRVRPRRPRQFGKGRPSP
jgi:hypothetical protein